MDSHSVVLFLEFWYLECNNLFCVTVKSLFIRAFSFTIRYIVLHLCTRSNNRTDYYKDMINQWLIIYITVSLSFGSCKGKQEGKRTNNVLTNELNLMALVSFPHCSWYASIHALLVVHLVDWRVKTFLTGERMENLVSLGRKRWHFPKRWPLFEMLQSPLGIKSIEQRQSSLLEFENEKEKQSISYKHDYNNC